MGVTVPGLGKKVKIPGLMFADDLVTMSGDGASMSRMADHLSEWTTANEMAVGILKCGVMVVGGKNPPIAEGDDSWAINGERVPVVESYKYLGIDITPNLELSEVMKGQRIARGNC